MKMELLTYNKPSSPDPLHQEVKFKRPLSYTKMENLIKEMQDPEHGVPVRSQKLFLTSIPAAFAGYDIIEWLMERLSIEDSVEAIHLANLLCQHGYFFPVVDNRMFSVKDDSSLYRFQTPYYWPSQYPLMDSVDYAIYLVKRSLRNKQKHGLDDYEVDALAQLRKNLNQKWDFVSMQADEQVRISKERKKVDKMVTDAQERAFWRVLRPPLGSSCCVETPPMYKHDFHAKEGIKQIRRTNLIEDLRAEVDLLRMSCIRTRIKVSQALESLASHCESYHEHDSFLVARQPSNPWISDDPCYWIINAPLIEIPTERRVKKWAISMEDLVLDPTGLREITAYLKKEYCHENIRFWLAVRDLRYGPTSQLPTKAQHIYSEFLSAGAPCEINIDMKAKDAVQKELNYVSPSRFTFDPAAEHVYTMLLKKDCYPRFIRSEQYKLLLANALQPINQKKRLDKFLSYLALGKKKSSTATPPIYPVGGVLTIPPATMGLGEMFKAADEAILMATGNKCDLLSASSLDADKLSVMADCQYGRSQGSFDDVCPWESMEKLPEKPPSLTQSVVSPLVSGSKPSTSATALLETASTSAETVITSQSTSFSSTFNSITTVNSTAITVTATTTVPSSNTKPTESHQQGIFSTSVASAVPLQNILPKQSSEISSSLPSTTLADHSHQQSPENPVSSSSHSVNQVTTQPRYSMTSIGSEVGSQNSSTATGKESEIPLFSKASMLDELSKERKDSIALQQSPTIPSPKATEGFPSPPPPESVDPCCSSESELHCQHESVPQQQNQASCLLPTTISLSSQMVISGNRDQQEVENINLAYNNSSDENSGVESVPNLLDNNTHATVPQPDKEVCPWDHENGTRPETITFVKTYSTLGYL